MGRLAKLADLPPAERQLLVCGWAEVLVMRAAIWMFPYARVRRIVQRRALRRFGADRQRPAPNRIAWAVGAASGLVPGGRNCLVRALATETMLGRYGYPGELRFGVEKDAAGGIRAHAWLESGGRPIIGDFELDRYATMTAPRGDAH
ncbi:MAG TPA: lasso peptide biosynthesis B2 protein [Candidatus Binataceae bacterium]|nr:lasso peptide biosynthesis B2 protein [Candidatus Binataceae bacterium]